MARFLYSGVLIAVYYMDMDSSQNLQKAVEGAVEVKATVRIILICFMLTSCATVYPECKEHPKGSDALRRCNTDVREWRQETDKINFGLCEQAYKQMDLIMVHIDHSHDQLGGVTPFDIRMDLYTNSCRTALQDYWADY